MINREQALEIFKKYNETQSLYYHALCVESVMRLAAEMNGEDVEYWGIVGLLHDVDYEKYPEEHCTKAVEILKEHNVPDDVIHAICSHAWGMCSDVEPVLQMEKILFAIDELTGLVYATALMRPEKMVNMSLKSVKKKWNTKSFASGVDRDVITKGSQMCGIEVSELINMTIKALTSISSEIGL